MPNGEEEGRPQKPRDVGREIWEGAAESSWIEKLVNAAIEGFLGMVGTAAEWFARAANFYLARFGKAIARAQAEDAPEFYDLLATAVWDLTGVEVDANQLKATVFARGRVAGMSRIGAEIFNLLAHEFVTPEGRAGVGAAETLFGEGIGGLPVGELTPEQGVEGARRFLGFLMSFAIREGNMRLFSEAASISLIDNYSGYAAELARNLSLGRLSRQALRPLMDALIADPLEWALRKQYRPTLYSENQAIDAWFEGALGNEELLEELARKGWKNEKIQALIRVRRPRLPTLDMNLLVQFGVLTRGEAIDRLKREGWTEQDAELRLRADELRRVRAKVDEYVNVLESQALRGFLARDPGENLATFRDLIEGLPLSEEEKRWEKNIVGARFEFPDRELTLGQMRQAFIDGIVDLAEWEEFLVQERYSGDDRTILTLQLLLEQKEEADRRKAREEVAARRAKKAAEKAGGEPGPPGTPTLP